MPSVYRLLSSGAEQLATNKLVRLNGGAEQPKTGKLWVTSTFTRDHVRFLAELVKFGAAPPSLAFGCLKACLDDFAGPNVDVTCALLEGCGRYLAHAPHTKSRTHNLLVEAC